MTRYFLATVLMLMTVGCTVNAPIPQPYAYESYFQKELEARADGSRLTKQYGRELVELAEVCPLRSNDPDQIKRCSPQYEALKEKMAAASGLVVGSLVTILSAASELEAHCGRSDNAATLSTSVATIVAAFIGPDQRGAEQSGRTRVRKDLREQTVSVDCAGTEDDHKALIAIAEMTARRMKAPPNQP